MSLSRRISAGVACVGAAALAAATPAHAVCKHDLSLSVTCVPGTSTASIQVTDRDPAGQPARITVTSQGTVLGSGVIQHSGPGSAPVTVGAGPWVSGRVYEVSVDMSDDKPLPLQVTAPHTSCSPPASSTPGSPTTPTTPGASVPPGATPSVPAQRTPPTATSPGTPNETPGTPALAKTGADSNTPVIAAVGGGAILLGGTALLLTRRRTRGRHSG